MIGLKLRPHFIRSGAVDNLCLVKPIKGGQMATMACLSFSSHIISSAIVLRVDFFKVPLTIEKNLARLKKETQMHLP